MILVVVDQAIKLLVHFHMDMGPAGEIALIGNTFKLHYLLNQGMAFGLSFGSLYGKLFLSLFRLAAIITLFWLFFRLLTKDFPIPLLLAILFILAGASGNLIDSVFYGVLLNNAPYDSLTPWFHGQVIDMFYIDIWEGYLAEWIPYWGGRKVALLPIFNLADVFILVGVIMVIWKREQFLKKPIT